MFSKIAPIILEIMLSAKKGLLCQKLCQHTRREWQWMLLYIVPTGYKKILLFSRGAPLAKSRLFYVVLELSKVLYCTVGFIYCAICTSELFKITQYDISLRRVWRIEEKKYATSALKIPREDKSDSNTRQPGDYQLIIQLPYNARSACSFSFWTVHTHFYWNLFQWKCFIE